MKKTIKKYFAIIFLSALAALPLQTFAQPDPDPGCSPCCGQPGCADPCPPQCVPIDGGLSLLIAAGIGLGAKKAYDRKKAAAKIAE